MWVPTLVCLLATLDRGAQGGATFGGTVRSQALAAGSAAGALFSVRRELAGSVAVAALAPLPNGKPFALGAYAVSDIWVNPATGNDANSGATRAAAKRTLTAAWSMIPTSTQLTSRGFRLRLTAGRFTESMRERACSCPYRKHLVANWSRVA